MVQRKLETSRCVRVSLPELQMAKKRKYPPPKPSVNKAAEPKPIFMSPFKDLKKMLAERKLADAPPNTAQNGSSKSAAQIAIVKTATAAIAAETPISSALDDDA